MEADLIVTRARVATMNPEAPWAEAFAVRGRRIVDVGAADAIAAWRGPRTQVLDARGRRVVPGFIDSHMHVVGFGLSLVELGLAGTRSLAEMRERVRRYARELPEGAWVLGRGWDEAEFAEGRLPHRRDLDAVTGGRPALLYRHCGHVGVANTAALRLAGLLGEGDTPRPERYRVPGGVVDLDEDGRPTGVLREGAMELVARHIPVETPEGLRAAIARATEEAARHGVTAIHSNDGAAEGWPDLGAVAEAYRDLEASGRLAVRIWWDFPVERLEEAMERGWSSGMPLEEALGEPEAGAGRVHIGSAKIFTDGSLGGHTAALFQPYADRPDTRGVLLWEDEDLQERMARAFGSGIAVCAHAIGDRAAEQVITAVERAFAAIAEHAARGAGGSGSAGGVGGAGRASPAPAAGARGGRPRHPSVSRPRLIHCQIMRPDAWPRMARLGIVADVQPRFVASDLPIVERRVGAERARSSYAWRSIAAAGVAVAFGSDCPVEPIAPMEGIYAAVTRQTMDGEPEGGWQPQERLSVTEAMALYTRGGAYAVGAERERGRLAPGYAADFVLLDEDPWRVPPAELRHIRALATYVAGRATYRDPSADVPDGR
ncbi:MAG: amidohydrolase [Firmicutes bacterium]|nr:amidohydrolase [Bacillota bacterium]